MVDCWGTVRWNRAERSQTRPRVVQLLVGFHTFRMLELVIAYVQMWVAAGELLRRGADISATDKAGKTPLDAAVDRMCHQEGTGAVPMDAAAEEKVQAIRSSFKFKRLPDARQSYAEDFLRAHLQSGQLPDEEAFDTAIDTV